MEEKQIVAFNDINRLPVADVSRRTPPRFKQLKHMIGNTPLLAIHFTFKEENGSSMPKPSSST